MSALFGYLLLAFMLGLIPAIMAERKGRSLPLWMLYGMFLFPFAMIHAIVISEKNAEQTAKETQLSTVKANTYANVDSEPTPINLNCPVEVKSFSISLSSKKDKAYADIIFQTTSNKPITALKLRIYCYNAFNEPVMQDNVKYFDKVIQELNLRKGVDYSSLFELKGFPGTRKIKIVIFSVLFADGTKEEYSDSDIAMVLMNIAEGEELNKLKQAFGNDAICYAEGTSKFWICTCSKVNDPSFTKCARCGRQKDMVLYHSANSERVGNVISSRFAEKQAQDIINKKQYVESSKTLGLWALIFGLANFIMSISYSFLLVMQNGDVHISDIFGGFSVVLVILYFIFIIQTFILSIISIATKSNKFAIIGLSLTVISILFRFFG